MPAFQAGVPVKVPLWLALQLREKNKCIIARPTWMNLDSLKAVFAAEKRDGRTLTPLPYYFSEIAHLLCRRVPEDMGADVDAIMATLADIEETRAEKLKAGTDFVLTRSKDPGAMRDLYIPVPNIVEAEYASLRIGFCKVRSRAMCAAGHAYVTSAVIASLILSSGAGVGCDSYLSQCSGGGRLACRGSCSYGIPAVHRYGGRDRGRRWGAGHSDVGDRVGDARTSAREAEGKATEAQASCH